MLVGISQNFQSIIGRVKYYVLERYHVQAVQIGMILLCLALSALATLLFYERALIGIAIVAMFAGVAVLPLVYFNMEKMLMVLIVISTALNLSVGTGTGTPITLTLIMLLLLIGLWAFRILIAERSLKNFVFTPATIPVFVFAIVVIIAMWWSTNYVEPDLRFAFADKINPRMMTALVLIISPITPLLFGSLIRHESTLKFITWWFVGYGLVAVTLLIVLPNSFPHFILNARGQLPAWAATLALGQVLFNPHLSKIIRLVALGSIGLWLYLQVGLGITWISGWLTVFVGLGIVVFLYSRKFVLVAMLGVAIFGLLNISYINEILEAENEESGETRLLAGQQTFSILGRHFLFGTGPAGYHFYIEHEVRNQVIQLSHNNYIDIMAQTGVVGFSFYILTWAGLGWMCFRAYMTSPANTFRHGLSVSLLAAWFVTMLSMALGDWVTPFPYTQGLAGISYTIWHWIMPGLAIALYQLNKHSPHVTDATESNSDPMANPRQAVANLVKFIR